MLNLQFSGHPKSLIALQREARKAQTLAHRNIVTVYDFDRDGPVVFLTMECLSGKPLSQILKAPGFNGMPMAKAMPIIAGMCRMRWPMRMSAASCIATSSPPRLP